MRTESNIKPLVQHEIEALPKMVGRTCTVIFYENIEGPIEKEEGDQVYTYDRYTPLNSNLILLIPRLCSLPLILFFVFKFQSDSINTSG